MTPAIRSATAVLSALPASPVASALSALPGGPGVTGLVAAVAVVLAGGGSRRSPARQPRWTHDVEDPSAPTARGGRRAAGGVPGRHRSARLVLPVVVAALLASVGVVGPVLTLGLVASGVLGRAQLVRRAHRRQQRASEASFPDLVDLFRIAAAAGHPVHRCLEVVAVRAPAPVRAPLAATLARVQRGVPLSDALAVLGPELGATGPVLTDALRAALRTGAPLGPVLDRVGAVARDRRARTAQAAARRLPVTMLFPLVFCVLPAFGLLGVVPLLAGSLGSLAP